MKKLYILFYVLSALSCSDKIDPIRPSTGTFQSIDYKESSVTLPINFDIKQLEKELNKEIPRGLVYHQHDGINGFKTSDIHLYRDNDISFDVENNKLRFAIPIRITAYAAKSKNILGIGEVTKTGKGEAKAIIFLDVNLNLQPDYTFSTQTDLSFDLQKAEIKIPLLGNIVGRLFGKPQITISIKSLVRPELDNAIKKAIPDLNSFIENELDKFNIKGEVQKYWTQLGEPKELQDNIWLASKPTNIHFNNLSSNGQTSNFKVGLSSILKLIVGEKPETNSLELPNIKIDQLESGGFNIYLPTIIKFNEIKNNINKEIGGKTYFSNDKKYRLTIKNVEVFGTSNDESKIIIGVNFKGKLDGFFNKTVKGVLWFTLSPEYNKETSIVSLKELKLTPETDNEIADKAIPWLLDKFYMKEFLNKATFDLSKDIAKYKNVINSEIKEIKLDRLTINGNLEQLIFEGFRIDQNQLYLVISANGSLTSKVSE